MDVSRMTPIRHNLCFKGQVDNLADRDAGPKPIGAFNNKLKISYRIRELDPGLHMLEAIYHYKGNPPNHGGTAIFLKTSVVRKNFQKKKKV